MITIGTPTTLPPATFASPLQQRVYATLQRLGIPFVRVDTSPAVTMDDCLEIDRTLGVRTVKTLFLCNRQRSAFYLLVMRGDKPFVTRDFSQAMGIPRVSFAPAELLLGMMHTPVGGASVLSLVADTAAPVRLAVDADVAADPLFGCNDGTPTCYMRLATADILGPFLQATGHQPSIITL